MNIEEKQRFIKDVIKLQESFTSLYDSTDFISIVSGSIHLTKPLFLELFNEYEQDRGYLEAYVKGVRFFCIEGKGE